MDVPLWLYLLTTFGVAAIGIVGVWLSNRAHSRSIERQLTHARDQATADRQHEHERWLHSQRTAIYMAHVGTLTYSSDAKIVARKGADATAFLDHFEIFNFWASPETVIENIKMLKALSELADAALEWRETNQSDEQLKEVGRRISTCNVVQIGLYNAMREDLGIAEVAGIFGPQIMRSAGPQG